MRPAERAAGILPAEARRIPPRGTFPRPPAVRAVCRRDARQHAVKTAVRGPQRRGVQVRLPLGGPIPSRRDQCTVTTGRGTCLVPSRGDLSWPLAGRPPATRSACRASHPQRGAEFCRYPPGVGMRPAERAAGILPAEARRIPPRGTFPRAPAVRAVCRRDARQHAVKTALRGPQQCGVRGRLPPGEPIPTRRDQFTVTTGRGTCLVPSRGDLWSNRWRVAPATRSAGRASRPQHAAEFYRYPPRVGMDRRNVLPASCRQRLAESRPVGPFRARPPSEPSAGGTHGSTL